MRKFFLSQTYCVGENEDFWLGQKIEPFSLEINCTCCCWSKLSAWGFDCSLIASFNFSFSSCSSCNLKRLVSGDGWAANGDWWKPAWSPNNGFVCINWANAAGLSRICGGSDWIIFEMLPANPYCAIKKCYFSFKEYKSTICRIVSILCRCWGAWVRSPWFPVKIGIRFGGDPLLHNFLHSLIPLPIAHFGVTGFNGGAALAKLRFQVLQLGRHLILAVITNSSFVELFSDLKFVYC